LSLESEWWSILLRTPASRKVQDLPDGHLYTTDESKRGRNARLVLVIQVISVPRNWKKTTLSVGFAND